MIRTFSTRCYVRDDYLQRFLERYPSLLSSDQVKRSRVTALAAYWPGNVHIVLCRQLKKKGIHFMGQELFPLQWRMDAARKLQVDKTFVPCPVKSGDEIYPNGLFHFNITRILKQIEQNPC